MLTNQLNYISYVANDLGITVIWTEVIKVMEKEYDFSGAEQGRFYRPIDDLDIPVYLDKNVITYKM